MKTPILTMTLAAAIAAAPASYAGHKWKHQPRDGFYDYAKVIHVEPVVRTVHISVPERECWEEEVRHPVEHVYGPDPAGSMIVGGVIGGVVGHQFGHGRGRDAATLAGTLIGASIGHDMARRSTQTVVQERVSVEHRCRITDRHETEERVDGYRVTYRYKGETFRTRLPYDPGDRIRVRVGVSPAGY